MRYIIRLDDASEKRNVENWTRMENLLDKYSVKPLVGIIPNCEDEEMAEYSVDTDFWDRVLSWQKKGWTLALHGYNHVYTTECGGINPVNLRSEFAGVPLSEQKEKIRGGIRVLSEHGVVPQVFFAPSHTFDENTLVALSEESDIRIISDTIATKPYSYKGFTFVPQQSGRVRKLRFNTVTFCYHPNIMKDADFAQLEAFIVENRAHFVEFPMECVTRKRSLLDKLLNYLYMRKHR